MRYQIEFEPDVYRMDRAKIAADSGETFEARRAPAADAVAALEIAATGVAAVALVHLWKHSVETTLAAAALAAAVFIVTMLLRAARDTPLVVSGSDGQPVFRMTRNSWRDGEFSIEDPLGHAVGSVRTEGGAWKLVDARGATVAAGEWKAPKIARHSWASLPHALKFSFEEAPLSLSGEAGSTSLAELTPAAAAVEADDALAQADARLVLGAAFAGITTLQDAVAS